MRAAAACPRMLISMSVPMTLDCGGTARPCPIFFFKNGTGRPSGDAASFASAIEHGIAVPADALIEHFEADELAWHASFFLARENVAAEEGGFFHFAESSPARLPRAVSGAVNFMPVETHARLRGEECCACRRPQGIILADSPACIRSFPGFSEWSGANKFQGVLTGVPSTRNRAINAAYFAEREMIVADGLRRDENVELLQFFGARALHREFSNSAGQRFRLGRQTCCWRRCGRNQRPDCWR